MTVNVLDRVAQLIRENPSITVQEIATRLGYSEEKSIYYWLEKSKYYGIKEFKKAVLTGEYRPQEAAATAPEEGIKEPDTFLLYPTTEVPLVTRFTSSGEPQFAEGRTLSRQVKTLSQGSFAYRLRTEEYAPLLIPRDLVLTDPAETPANGDLVLLWLPPSEVLLRRYYAAPDRTFFVHPIHGRNLAEEKPHAQPKIIGKVLQLIRSL
ncbi:MAG: hypothetical protein K6T75_11165 [Acetobacteraceae bacterium]|nr:hypothetical protein [Acetobacteraceae bacterium]